MRTLRLGIAVMLLCFTQKSHASLVLTAAGIADGFSLSVFASGIPNNGSFGPMGTATTSSGNVLVTDFGGSPPGVFSWPDVDGQTPGSALGFNSVGTSNFGITNAQGKIYSVDFGAGNINLLNNDGSLNSISSHSQVGRMATAMVLLLTRSMDTSMWIPEMESTTLIRRQKAFGT